MTIHREGYPSIVLTLSFLAIINGIAYFLEAGKTITIILQVFSFAFLLIILQFFRSPKRDFKLKEGDVISPADGKVVVIEEVEETEYLKEKRIQISVFMSPVNVHINRYPISGVLNYFKYHPGLYLVAWHPKSSTENERTTFVVEDAKGRKVLFRQIAGALARRIVAYGKEGDKVSQTEECGFIKFGSRVDIFVPVGTTIHSKLGDTVKGGITSLATLK